MMSAAGGDYKPKLFIKTATALSSSRHMTSPSGDATSTMLSPPTEDTTELGVQLTVGRRLKHIAMKATFDQPRNKDSHIDAGDRDKSTELYASEILGSFVVDRKQHRTATATATVVEVPLSTLIVVGSPFSHTVHYINTNHDDERGSPSSTSNCSSASSPYFSADSRGGLQVSMFQFSDEPRLDVMSTGSSDDPAVGELSDLDDLRESDLLPLPLCSESPWYLGLTDDELRRLLSEPNRDAHVNTAAADDLLSAAELSWPSPSVEPALSGGDTNKSDVHDYSTPEVIELLDSVYDDWLRGDPDVASFFSQI